MLAFGAMATARVKKHSDGVFGGLLSLLSIKRPISRRRRRLAARADDGLKAGVF